MTRIWNYRYGIQPDKKNSTVCERFLMKTPMLLCSVLVYVLPHLVFNLTR